MNKLKLYRIESNIYVEERKIENNQFLDDINMLLLNEGIELSEDAISSHLNIVLVESGGSEQRFLEIKDQLTSPIILINNGRHNSLAASMEIKTYIANYMKYEAILFSGSPEKIAEILKTMNSVFLVKEELKNQRLGVIGKPSNWLISSDVNYKEVYDKFGITLIDIDYDEFKLEIDKKSFPQIEEYFELSEKCESLEELDKAFYVYGAIFRLINKYNLTGFTLRCFDLLDLYKTTSCIALSIFNKNGIVATCEGDIPTLITQIIVNKLTSFSSFQANPSYFYYDKGQILFAHCQVPLNMCSEYELDTHFESDLSLAVKGKFVNGKCSVIKLSPDLKTYIAFPGEIIESPDIKGYCRSQMKVAFDQRSFISFFSENFANHVVISYGDITNDFASLIEFINSEYERTLKK